MKCRVYVNDGLEDVIIDHHFVRSVDKYCNELVVTWEYNGLHKKGYPLNHVTDYEIFDEEVFD